jgi:hypothetical protein
MHLYSLPSARKLLLATAAAALLTLAATSSPAQDDQYAQDDPPAQAGRLSMVSGSVSIQEAGSDDWGQAMPNLPLGPGDRIFTDNDGRAEIQVGQTYIRVGPNSDVSFVADTPWSISVGVAQGSVHIHTLGLWQDQWLHVNSPSGSAGISQPADIRVDVMPDQEAAIFTSFSNNALITGAGGFSQYIGNGSALELIGSNPVYPQWLQPADWDELDKWSHWRDQQIANAVSYRYVSPEIPGANELDASGTWLPGTDYGAIWFPNNVPADWAPYHYGHWVNHDPWGWVWVEDESWGYAPFHYGRWVSFEGRWGWVPGPPAAHPVWSPALVVFAGGIHIGGGGVSAWFPLGPGEPYRPWYHASPRYIDEINRSNITETRIVHVQTTYVNINVVNVTYVNRSIGVSAMNHDDFAAGRSARTAAVVVDRRQFDHVQVLDRPEVQPVRVSVTIRPPARPVPVRAERPVLINETGKLVSAKPGAQPIEVPVKAAPPVRPLPGRTVVAPPPAASAPARMPGGPMVPGARPAPLPAPAAPPIRNQVVEPIARPIPPQGPPPTSRPAPPPVNQPMARPVPQPVTPPAPKPAAQPYVAPPAARPYTPPQPPPAARPTPPPVVRPVTPPPPPPAARPVAPPPARPTPPPAAQPAPKPAPPPVAKPQQDKKNDKDKKDETKPKN